MQKSGLLWGSVALLLSIFIWHFPEPIDAQITSDSSSNTTPSTGNSSVSVSASLSIQVSNETLKVKDGMLRSAINNFLNSGPNVLKTSDSDKLIVKTQIANELNDDTQNVQGVEATSAIIGVEVSKALKSAVASSTQPNGTTVVNVQTSSSCKPSAINSISCENSATIK